MQVAIGIIANRFEKQLDELLMDIFILCDEMAGTVCPCRINLLLIGMEGNMFQESFQLALICRWIWTVLGRLAMVVSEEYVLCFYSRQEIRVEKPGPHCQATTAALLCAFQSL